MLLRNRRSLRAELGTAYLELVLSFPAFFILIMSGVELVRYTYTAQALDNAVKVGARYSAIRPNAHQTPSDIHDKIESIGGVPFPLTSTTFDMTRIRGEDGCSPTNQCACHNLMPGGTIGCRGDWMNVSAQDTVSLFGGLYSITIQSSAVYKNENWIN
jgi:hypothetical protein